MLAEEEKVVSIVDDVVKVIENQIKKLGSNEAKILQVQHLILSKALPQIISKVNTLLLFERRIRIERSLNKDFLSNLVQIIGYISRTGGLTKFEQIKDQIKRMARRVVQSALCMTKINDFSLIDRLNGAIYTKVHSEFLSGEQCQLIFNQSQR